MAPKPFYVYFKGVEHDISSFISVHPGGEEVFSLVEGKEISDIMNDHSIHTHSEGAYKLLESMREDSPSSFFDLKKPLVHQLFSNKSITKYEYIKWIHEPVLNKSIRLFENPILEMFSKTPWWIIPLFWGPISMWLLFITISDLGVGISVATYIFGVCLWSLIEYIFHRFLFHFDNYILDHRFVFTIHFLVHGIHHFIPMDGMRLVMPPVLSSVLFIIGWHVMSLITFPILSLPIRIAMLGGIILGYIFYDLVHYHLHHSTMLFKRMYVLKENHMYHHFKSPDLGFGVTSNLWDFVFGTSIKVLKDNQ